MLGAQLTIFCFQRSGRRDALYHQAGPSLQPAQKCSRCPAVLGARTEKLGLRNGNFAQDAQPNSPMGWGEVGLLETSHADNKQGVTSNAGSKHRVTSNAGNRHRVTSGAGNRHRVTSNTDNRHGVTSNAANKHRVTSKAGNKHRVTTSRCE
jgi:hypothetical protein